MSVIVQLLGGLGNQLFQYAMGRTLAVKHSLGLRLDTDALNARSGRRYVLEHFSIQAKELSSEERRALKLQRGAHTRLGRLVSRVLGGPSIPVVRERTFGFRPATLDVAVPCYLQGYWQSPKYFASIEPTIRKELTLSEPLAGENAAIARKISECLAVSVHVRRGDYVVSETTNRYHGTCGPEYYSAAEALLRNRIGEPTFFVFSDDPDWVATNLRFTSRAVLVRHNGPEQDYEDLRLMTLCQHHIIANSTFSWWGAWLCANPGKIVVTPQKWFREAGHSTTDLIPEDWIRI